MSSSVCMLPLIAALLTGSQLPEVFNNPWQGINTAQQKFLENYYNIGVQDINSGLFGREELSHIASHDACLVNQFLAQNDFGIQLEDQGPNSIYLASVLKVLIEWSQKGIATTIKSERDLKTYPAVLMREAGQFTTVTLQNKEIHDRGIFTLTSKSGDKLYITCANRKNVPATKVVPLSGFKLVSHLAEISNQIDDNKCEHHDVEELIFPMIDYDQTENIDWALGMRNGLWQIAQALQQTKFQMNEQGAAVQSAAAVEMTLGEPNSVAINVPFYLWIRRQGVALPILAAYFDESSWKQPARLG